MLPKLIYRLLPYFYIGLGLLCMLVVESSWIFLSSLSLIAAGGIVLWMRHNNAVNPVEYVDINEIPDEEDEAPVEVEEIVIEGNADPLDHERRIDDERNFPIIDDKGGIIAFNRRTDESDKKD